LGDGEAARRLLEPLVDQIVRLPRAQLSASSLAVPCLAAARLDHREAAHRLYPVLRPYGEHVIATTIRNLIVCYGSGSLYLGLLATIMSRWAEACDHFEAAIGAHERLGARPLLAQTRYEYARMLLRRGQAADRSRALGLLEQASAAASAIGMAALAEGIKTLQAVEAGGTASAPERPSNVFRREGEYWTVCYEGAVVRLKDAKGLRHLARLLAHPAREFHVTDLETAARGGASPGKGNEPTAASWSCVGTSVTRGSCWMPPPRRPTRLGWRSCGRSWRRRRASATPSAPPGHAKSWTSWWVSWRGRSGWAAATAGRRRMPSAPGSTQPGRPARRSPTWPGPTLRQGDTSPPGRDDP
jgi:hypothetical protein